MVASGMAGNSQLCEYPAAGNETAPTSATNRSDRIVLFPLPDLCLGPAFVTALLARARWRFDDSAHNPAKAITSAHVLQTRLQSDLSAAKMQLLRVFDRE